MALSNIFREPRREIIESAVGIGVVAAIIVPFAFVDYYFAVWLSSDLLGQPNYIYVLVIGMLVGVFVGAFLATITIGFVQITHAIGDAICNTLERRGVHLRPRDRRTR